MPQKSRESSSSGAACERSLRSQRGGQADKEFSGVFQQGVFQLAFDEGAGMLENHRESRLVRGSYAS
jgi:hypothetical protein